MDKDNLNYKPEELIGKEKWYSRKYQPNIL